MSAAALAPGLSRKVKKLLETRTDAPDVAAALSALSTIYGENSPSARRQLRSTIENEAVNISQQYLSAMEDVWKHLDEIDAQVGNLSRMATALEDTAASASSSARPLLSEASSLEQALHSSRRRSELVRTFLTEYQLRDEELAALTQGAVGLPFFQALAAARRVHARCSRLLTGRHQRAGLELMESMAALVEAASERLCRWISEAAAGPLTAAEPPEPDSNLARAFAALAPRPVLYGFCAEEVAHARRAALLGRFVAALTTGPRAIELQAGDPRRYVADMLAWTHAALASENELLRALLVGGEEGGEGGLAGEGSLGGEGSQVERDASSASLEQPASELPSVKATLGVVSESVARPLKVRVEQVLLSGPNPVLAFWLSQLLGFYLDTVGALLPADGALVQALQGGRSMALRLCFEQFKQRGEKLARYPPPPPTDLSPPPAAVEAAQQAVELILCLEGGVQSAETHEGDAVRAALLPIALVCERSSEALDPHALTRVDEGGHLDPAGRRVYMLNCLSTLMAPLEGHAVAEGISAELGAMVEEHIRCLVEESRGRVLALCGLAEVAARVQFFKVEGASGGERAADQAGLDLSSVAKALRSFFGRVSDADALPTFGKLLAAPIKQDVTQRLLRELAAAYTDVYDLLHAPEGGYDGGEVAAVVRHSPDQIRTLLGVA